MKKFTTVLAILAICAALTGCGKDSTSNSSTTETGTPSTTVSTTEPSTAGTESTTSGTESTTAGTESAATSSDTSTSDTPVQDNGTEDGLIAITSDDVNKATASVSAITEVDGNKQFAYIVDVNGMAKIFNYYVFDSSDKFAYSYFRIEAQPRVSVNTLFSAMSIDGNFAEYTEVEPNVWQSPLSYPDETKEGVPLYSNGVQYAKDTLQEAVDLFTAMRDSGAFEDGSADITIGTETTDVFGDVTEGTSNSDTMVVEEGHTYTGSSLTLANPYAVNPDDLFDLESYTLIVKSGDTVALPVNSLPEGDITVSLDDSCATLIYNGELKLKGLYNGSTTLTITASNGKTGSIMIMVQ